MTTSLLSSSFNDNISCISHLLLYSQKSFFKADFNLLFEIIASCFSSGSPRTKSSSKHSSKKISNITKIKLSSSSTKSSKIETSLSKSSSSETTFSISIILLSFILVRKHLISLINFLELLLTSSTVWMMLNSSFSKNLFYLISSGLFTNSQNLIIILLWVKIHFYILNI